MPPRHGQITAWLCFLRARRALECNVYLVIYIVYIYYYMYIHIVVTGRVVRNSAPAIANAMHLSRAPTRHRAA